jgi:hypothetical protein
MGRFQPADEQESSAFKIKSDAQKHQNSNKI